jgi:hypothetical protein
MAHPGSLPGHGYVVSYVLLLSMSSNARPEEWLRGTPGAESECGTLGHEASSGGTPFG